MTFQSVIPTGTSRDDRPDMRDLNRYIVEQQAVQWERLGLELGLKDYHIANISKDYEHNPNRSVTCCRAMLEQWLREIPSPTWGKLDDAINKVNVVTQLSCHVKAVYKATRFTVAKDTWPPEQPREFTPLVLLHHEDEHSMRDITIVTEALHSGAISDVISATSSKPIAKRPRLHHHDKLGDALKASKTTMKVSEILAPLEVSDNPQTILIEGAPGIGKTILLKHIAYSWAEQGILQKYELVLLVYLRDPTVQKMSSLIQLFQYFGKSSMEGDVVALCINHFYSNRGKNLAFLIDGYDEFPEELRDNSLIADILNRQLLPDCGLVVSSRPHASLFLRKEATLQVDILGFTEEQRKHYIEHSLNDQSQIKQLTAYLEQHINISSLCYVPFNIALLLFLYKQGVPLPNNATQLYNIFICLTIRRNITKYGITIKLPITDINNLPEPYGKFIQQLSKLSLQALNNNQLIFTLDQIKQFCPQVESIPGALNAFGLLQAIEHVSIFQTATTFNFLHLSVQEFLAANHITTLTPDEELSILTQYFWSDSHSNMFTMYITLTKGQRSTFRKFLSGGDDSVAIHHKFLSDKFKCIHLYQCLNEANGYVHVCRTIEREFSDRIINFCNTTLGTIYIENIITFLTCSSIKQWKMLNLGSCNIKDAGLYTMHRMLHSSPITIEELVLSTNELSSSCDSSLADIVITCAVKMLDVNGNGTLGQTEIFYPAILSPSSMLKRLNVANTILSNKVSILIFNLLQEENTKLEWLDISDNEITDDSCDVIVKTLQVNNVLQHLSLNGNRISKQATQLIVNSLHVNNVLAQLRISAKDSTKILTQLQDEINVERRKRGVHVQLNITIEDHKDKLFIARMLYEAKKQGLTIKLRHAKILFCGHSKAGKSSFSHLLRNKEHKDQYKSTPVADTKQLLVSGKVSVTGTDWKDLDSNLEIQQLRKRFMYKLSKQPNLPESLDYPPHVDHHDTKAESDITEQFKPIVSKIDSNLSDTHLDQNIFYKPVLVEAKITSDTDVPEPVFTSSASTESASEEWGLPEVWDVLTLLDTGGQPEFINLLPTINASTAIAFVIFNMCDGFGCLDTPVIAQHSNISYEKCKLNYSNFNLLKCLLSSIEDSALKECFYPKQVNVQKDQHPKTVVYFVGTHADKLKEKLETVVANLNEKIIELVEDMDDTKIMIQSDGCDADKYLHAVDNTVPREGEKNYSLLLAQRIRQESKKILDKKALFEIPVTWFILELELRLLYEVENKVCVPLSQVKRIADDITKDDKLMEMWQIEEILKFYHLFGVLLYFDEVEGMKDHVITYPQWLFNNLNKIIECKFSEGLHDVKAINKVKKEGIFSRDLLTEIDLDIQDLNIESFFNLLMHLRIFAQIDDGSYFMPSVLPVCDRNSDEKEFFNEAEYGKPVLYKHNAPFVEVKPLLIGFASGMIPRGLFGLLVVQLLQNNTDFKLYGKNTKDKLCRCSDLISFIKEPCYYVTLQDKVSFLELQVRVMHNEPSIHCVVQKAVTDALNKVFDKFHWKFSDLRYGFLCQYANSQPHITRLDKDKPFPFKFPKYSHCEDHHGIKLTEEHSIWFFEVVHPEGNLNTMAKDDNCPMIIKKLKDKYEELLHLPYPDMSGKLYAKDVITNQEKLEINNLIGKRQMERVLDIIIQSLHCNVTAKYKGFLKAMEESDDLLLRKKAKELTWYILTDREVTDN